MLHKKDLYLLLKLLPPDYYQIIHNLWYHRHKLIQKPKNIRYILIAQYYNIILCSFIDRKPILCTTYSLTDLDLEMPLAWLASRLFLEKF